MTYAAYDDDPHAPVRAFGRAPGSVHEHPFSGEIEFFASMEVLGVTSQRRVRVRYGYTPDWEYCTDRGVLRLAQNGGSSTLRYELMKRVEGIHVGPEGRHRRLSYDLEWCECAFFNDGYFDHSVDWAIDERIERLAQAEDAMRRRIAGLPAVNYPTPVPYSLSLPSGDEGHKAESDPH